jgi:hypothetical protein
MSGKSKSKNKDADLAKQLIVGIQKRLASVPQMTFGGGTFTPAQVEAQLQKLPTLRDDVTVAKSAWETKLSDERDQEPALREFLTAFVSFVRVTFGKSPDALADFGLKPRKAPKPLTGDELAAKAKKAKATRKARGTVSKKEKLAIKGNVAGVVVTPITVTTNNPEPVQVAAATPNTSPNGASK